MMYKNSITGSYKLLFCSIFLFLLSFLCVGEILAGGYLKGFQDTIKSSQVNDTLSSPVTPKDSIKPQLPDSVVYKQTEFTREEIIRGERLFNGLVFAEKTVDCGSCHNTKISDTLNWNPDGVAVSVKYLDKSARDLSRILLKPSGKKMGEVHKDINLTAADIVLIKAYMDELAHEELVEPKPIVTNLLLLIAAFVIFILATGDLITKRLFKSIRINWIIITITSVVITWILADNAIKFGRAQGFSPDQPIKFSHAVHAGQNKTDCNYCHYSARIGKSSGIPAPGVCWNCHFLVRNGTRSGAWEIAKVVQAIETNDPVEWVRIYRLPDFVYFNHSQHVVAGDIDCGACHGDVTTMDRLVQETDLSMGWCLDCHETRKVNLDGNYYQAHYAEQFQKLREGKIDSLMVKETGGWDCGKCHY